MATSLSLPLRMFGKVSVLGDFWTIATSSELPEKIRTCQAQFQTVAVSASLEFLRDPVRFTCFQVARHFIQSGCRLAIQQSGEVRGCVWLKDS